MEIQVHMIEPQETYSWLKYKHYAKRIPSIAHSFGLFQDRVLIGVITYGIPANNNLNVIAGAPGLELNRLCLEDTAPKNSGSVLVGRSLQMIPKPSAIVSYADCGQGHVGYIYQATNWIYTGMGSGDIEFLKDGRKFHRKSLFNIYGTGSKEVLEGHGYVAVPVEAKHRYVFFCGNKRQKRNMGDELSWPVLPYPKGETKRYDASAKVQTQMRMF